MPPCEDGSEDHDWQAPYGIVGGIEDNPGCWGHGGGVVYHEVCMRCGLTRTTDTWAQRPDNGEQGLTAVSYDADKFRAEWAEFLSAHNAD